MEQEVKQALALMSGTSADDWFLVSRARHGMAEVFKALQPGEVITQPFTCITAVNPIIEAGHTPFYCDIEPGTYSTDPAKLTAHLNDSTKAVIVQHTFGIPANIELIRTTLPAGVLLMEDSAHRLGFIAKDKSGSYIADVSVHSFGAEKSLSTKYGGAIWVNPELEPKLRQDIIDRLERLPRLTWHQSQRLRMYPALNKLANTLPLLRKPLVQSRLMITPVMPSEQATCANYLSASKLPHWALRGIAQQLRGFDAVTASRKQHAKTLVEQLNLPADLTSHDLIRMPILCTSKEQANELFRRFQEEGLSPGKWYRPLLFPGTQDEAAYHFDVRTCPIAVDLSERILNVRLGEYTTSDTILRTIHEITR